MSNSATLWTVAYQTPLSVGFFQARVLEWVAISFFRGIFLAQGLNPGLLPWHAESFPSIYLATAQKGNLV